MSVVLQTSRTSGLQLSEGGASLVSTLFPSGLGGGTGAGASALVGTYVPAADKHETNQAPVGAVKSTVVGQVCMCQVRNRHMTGQVLDMDLDKSTDVCIAEECTQMQTCSRRVRLGLWPWSSATD